MPYEFYKIAHLTLIVALLSLFSIKLCGFQKKIFNILTGVFTLLVFVAGMGLIARLGFPHSEPWPFWIHAKIVIWLIIGVVTPVICKRLPKLAPAWLWVNFALVALAAYFAVIKP